MRPVMVSARDDRQLGQRLNDVCSSLRANLRRLVPRSAPGRAAPGERVGRPVAAQLFSLRGRRGPAFPWAFRLGFEAPAVVAGFNNVAVAGETVAQGGGPLRLPAYARPRAECQVGTDEHGVPLMGSGATEGTAPGRRTVRKADIRVRRGAMRIRQRSGRPLRRGTTSRRMRGSTSRPAFRHGPPPPACRADRQRGRTCPGPPCGWPGPRSSSSICVGDGRSLPDRAALTSSRRSRSPAGHPASGMAAPSG